MSLNSDQAYALPWSQLTDAQFVAGALPVAESLLDVAHVETKLVARLDDELTRRIALQRARARRDPGQDTATRTDLRPLCHLLLMVMDRACKSEAGPLVARALRLAGHSALLNLLAREAIAASTWLLAHSLDRLASWRVFWNWLALAGVFWAVCDWLSGEVTPEGQPRARRLRRLVFVLAGNGALVALEGILQRFSGTPLLLWFQATHDNPTADAQFGPYAYRSNAAQFFNLLWPVALGWWWINQSRRREREREQGHQWLLPCVMLLVAGALVSMSRAGVAVALLQMGAAVLILLAGGAAGWRVRLSIVLVFAATLGAAFYFGWEQLAQRLVTASSDPLAGRTETYHLAARMTVDYPWFGVGPGAFDSVFQLYRNSPGDYWPAQLHNDWLEYLITFGRVGGALLLGSVALLAGRWFTPGGLRLPWTLVALIWVALLGCLLHARFDFPLQIYSIQFVCVLLGAILFSGSQRGG